MRLSGVRCGFLCLFATVALTGCQRSGIFDPHGPVASAEQLILMDATGIMLVVVAPVIVLTLAFAWWYRASNTKATYRPDWEYSGQIELVVWAIPAMVVILLAGVAWIGAHDLDPALPLESKVAPLRVEVVALDWKWLFIYPDQRLATVNELVIPAGTPIEFALTSATVMNAFFIPQLGSQIYTMPGMTTRLNLLAEEPGDYAGLSSHFSGDGFSDMHFVVHAVSATEFGAWAERAHHGAPTLTMAAYAALSQHGVAAEARYGDADPMVFMHIIERSVQPASANGRQ